jgi:hypothetical protein
MAAQPVPLTGPNDEVQIYADSVSGEVQINNGGMVKFQVMEWPIDPNTGQPYNTCMVNITEADISWATEDTLTQNTIKVGNGGGEPGRSR